MTKVVLVFFCALASLAAAPYAPLPKPPDGFELREVAQFPENPVRVVSNAAGDAIYVLAVEGNVYKIDLAGRGAARRVSSRRPG